MRIQLNKVLVFIALLGFIFASYSSEASSVVDELQEMGKDFFSSFSVKDTVENMTPSTIIGLCIAAVVLAIVFRGMIFFVIMFGVLVMMFGSTEKATDYLKEKFNFVKGVDLKPDSEDKEKK
ncbi:MAG: hypothetical protein ACR5K9_02000 [Wolbachia sp.]